MRSNSLTFGGLILALATVAWSLPSTDFAFGQQPGAAPADDGKAAPSPRYGAQLNDAKAYQGYTLIYPLTSKNTYLIDMQGRVVKKWESKYQVGQNALLLENGNLLRSAKLADSEALFAGAGGGGRIQEFSWDGKLLWDFKFHNDKQIQHHAITPMPNGNILAIVWERRTATEAVAAGVKPALAGTGDTLVDSIFEIQKLGLSSGKFVWKWHVWDHLIQDHDMAKANFGDVAKHPERIDANFVRNPSGGFGNLFAGLFGGKKDKEMPKADDPKDKKKDDALAKLKGLGYVGGGGGKRFAGFFPDWTHVNAVSFNPDLDQIMISSRMFSEVWIIDHSTTTAEAATSKGGKYGKGGDLLYRWGNPRAYRAGSLKDQRLFVQHDAHWIRPGLPGAGNLLVFNNGTSRPGSGNWSSADEIALPVDDKGRYELSPGEAWGPKEATWSYASPKKTDFYSVFMSSARRMPNGNTLIATGFNGSIVEVTPKSEMVWKYVAPFEGDVGSTLMFRLMGLGGRDAGAALFSAHRYGPDYKGFEGKELKAGDTVEELMKKDAEKKAAKD